jgi:hypothetical protein
LFRSYLKKANQQKRVTFNGGGGGASASGADISSSTSTRFGSTRVSFFRKKPILQTATKETRKNTTFATFLGGGRGRDSATLVCFTDDVMTGAATGTRRTAFGGAVVRTVTGSGGNLTTCKAYQKHF